MLEGGSKRHNKNGLWVYKNWLGVSKKPKTGQGFGNFSTSLFNGIAVLKHVDRVIILKSFESAKWKNVGSII